MSIQNLICEYFDIIKLEQDKLRLENKIIISMLEEERKKSEQFRLDMCKLFSVTTDKFDYISSRFDSFDSKFDNVNNLIEEVIDLCWSL